jgi:hypothetical protein
MRHAPWQECLRLLMQPLGFGVFLGVFAGNGQGMLTLDGHEVFLLLPLPPGEGWGEGLYCLGDLQQDSFEVLQHISVTKPQCVDTV